MPMKDCALFLDRDGVINLNYVYIHRPETFNFIDGILDLGREAHAQHYKLKAISNQAGITRIFYSESEFSELSQWICDQFLILGTPVSKVYFSPFNSTEGIDKYKKDDLSHKPHPDMLLRVERELNLYLGRSIFIGDNVTDIQAGIAACVGRNILFAKDESAELSSVDCKQISSLTNAIPLLNSKMSLREAL
jgi:D-glycero-D-manno-heptose 1,7-bisphosphate phosphatase